MERLQKLIAESGICSRRKAEELILKGKVKVNGEVITKLGTKVDSNDVILVDGKKIKTEKKEYYLLNKPRNYICSLEDKEGRKIITELIDTKARIYPVGRLDYDTTGLIIMTNDGTLANIIMHPKNRVEKTYLAKIKPCLTMEELFSLKAGISIDGIVCHPGRVKIKKHDPSKEVDLVEITIHEGRNHIIKNLFKAINHDVLKLTRTKYAFLEVGELQTGEYRYLTKEEVKKLYAYQNK